MHSMRHGVDGTAIPAHSKIYRVLTSKKDPMVHVGEKNYFHVSAFDVEEERFDFYYEIQIYCEARVCFSPLQKSARAFCHPTVPKSYKWNGSQKHFTNLFKG